VAVLEKKKQRTLGVKMAEAHNVVIEIGGT
jgi:hypothetical protein